MKIDCQIQHPLAHFDLSIDVSIDLSHPLVITGQSGSGKSQWLKILAGLIHPKQGYIRFDSETWLHTPHTQVNTQSRQIGYVFQNNELLPNFSVKQIIQLTMTYAVSPLSPGVQAMIVDQCGIKPLINQTIDELSGGEKQRLGIALACLRNPRLLLLDEPTASLDHENRQRVLDCLSQLHQQLGMGILMVTHQTEEALRIGKQLAVMEAGKIKHMGCASQLSQSQVLASNHGRCISIDCQALNFSMHHPHLKHSQTSTQKHTQTQAPAQKTVFFYSHDCLLLPQPIPKALSHLATIDNLTLQQTGTDDKWQVTKQKLCLQASDFAVPPVIADINSRKKWTLVITRFF